MNERTWWAKYVRPVWNQPLFSRAAWKIQDHVNKGLPDVLCCFRGVEVLIELKYDTKWPARPDTLVLRDGALKGRGLTVEQRRHLQLWHDAGGLAYVLYGVGQEWYLLPLGVVRPEGQTQEALKQVTSIGGLGYRSLVNVPDYFWRIYGHGYDRQAQESRAQPNRAGDSAYGHHL